MSAHTAGPWQAHALPLMERADQHRVSLGHPLSNEPGAFMLFTDDGRGNGLPLPERDRDANAALIAAAPDLLAALRAFLRAPSVGSDGPGSITIVVQDFNMQAARTAIARAEGRP